MARKSGKLPNNEYQSPCSTDRRSALAQKESDIRSTEKLLELIRNEHTVDVDDDKGSHPGAVNPLKQKTANLIPVAFHKRTVVGVDIGHSHIKLAKIIRTDKSAELIDYLDIPFTSSIVISDEKCLHALKAGLDQFCEGLSNFNLWGAIQSANVETRCIRIPKLPRKQVANAIFWTFTKKTPFDKKSDILDYEIIGDIAEGGVKKTEVLAFKAPKSDVGAYQAAFQKIGYPLKGISIVPFAIQNLFRSGIIAHPDQDTCCLFIGRDWSRIAIYNQGNLVLSRGIKAGMRSMVDAINSALLKEEDWNQSISKVNSDDAPGAEPDAVAINPKAQLLFFDFIGVSSPDLAGASSNQKIDRSRIFQMVLPAMERLIRQIERTFEHYTLNFNSEGVKRIFISGQVIANSKLVSYFETQLDMPVVPMNPFPAGSPFTQQIRIPDAASAKEAFVPAIGLALSSNSITPNFLFTHEDKDIVEDIRRKNMRILTICMLCLMVMIGVFSWQQKNLDTQRIRVEELNNQLIQYSPPAKKELLLALYAKAKQKKKLASQIIQRYAPAAIITELADITPSNIRLLSMDAGLAYKGAQAASFSSNSVTIEGIIFGDAGSFETILTNYLLSLKNSPLFLKPSVQTKQIEFYYDQEIMRFIARLEVI